MSHHPQHQAHGSRSRGKQAQQHVVSDFLTPLRIPQSKDDVLAITGAARKFVHLIHDKSSFLHGGGETWMLNSGAPAYFDYLYHAVLQEAKSLEEHKTEDGETRVRVFNWVMGSAKSPFHSFGELFKREDFGECSGISKDSVPHVHTQTPQYPISRLLSSRWPTRRFITIKANRGICSELVRTLGESRSTNGGRSWYAISHTSMGASPAPVQTQALRRGHETLSWRFLLPLCIPPPLAYADALLESRFHSFAGCPRGSEMVPSESRTISCRFFALCSTKLSADVTQITVVADSPAL